MARVLEIFTVYRTVKARALTRSAETLRRVARSDVRSRPGAPLPLPRAHAHPPDWPCAVQMVKIYDKKLVLVHQVR